MKVLFDHSFPFFLAHGGFQTQIEQTKSALEAVGVEVEFVRWWDDDQRGDLIHFFGRPAGAYVELARRKKIKFVLAELLTGVGSRSKWSRFAQKSLMAPARALLPASMITARLGWECYQWADACVALTPWEARLMVEIFSAPAERVHCVPNGVEPAFFSAPPAPRGQWLVCTATITERKRPLELAETAVMAGTPLWIIGTPYNDGDPYVRSFLQLVRQNPSILRYEGGLSDRAKLAAIYRQARGFVLLSTMESLSLSALEAAACECPLLLSDLPWARCVFEQNATYCPVSAATTRTARILHGFYEEAPRLPLPPKPKTWLEVARMFKTLYESVLKVSP